ncbi:MAG: hypothetical protein FWH27_19290, partial [Planctomycetaceae bacterium]|nr:hypothetical protein [Planctomycetaceae bacterium]
NVAKLAKGLFMTRLRLHLAVILFWTLFLCPAVAQDDSHRKKFIELGWDCPNTAYLKEHHEEMQRTTPFDGVMLALEGTAPDGTRYSSQSMMDAQAWDSAWFTQAIDNLKACRWTTFTDNFLLFNFTPGQVDWYDDSDWTILCNKTTLCAKIAKGTGLKGFAADFEPYGKEVFKYSSESGHSYDEMKQIARKRGKQWMEAIASEYPDMVLLTLFIADVNIQFHFHLSARYDHFTEEKLQSLPYGLLPAFFNGMLDAVPPRMRIVDGCENGYYRNGINEFARHALAIQSIGGPAIRLVAPENRQKYISQVQVGFGFYLDMYTNPEGDAHYRGPTEGGTRLDRLEENLTAALETADEYVWIYGEKRRWWKPTDATTQWQHWEDALPGMDRTIRSTKNPLQAAKMELAMLRKENRAVNLLKNPDFTESKPETIQLDGQPVEITIPAEWSFWQDKPIGTWVWDDGSAKLSGVPWGCILQGILPVKPGESYYVAIDGKQQGAGQINMTIGWADTEGKWNWALETRVFPFENKLDQIDSRELPNGWARAGGIVKIPEGAAELRVMAGVKDQSAKTDAAWFGNAVLIRLR